MTKPHPGYYLDVFLSNMGWQRVDVAIRSNHSKSHITRFISGQVVLKPKLAASLETATGIPEKIWMDWNKTYLTASQQAI